MRWIYADLKIARCIPQIRWMVLHVYVLRWVRLLLSLILLLPLLPFVALSTMTSRADCLAERLLVVLHHPARKLQERIQARRETIHRIMPAEEIRRKLSEAR